MSKIYFIVIASTILLISCDNRVNESNSIETTKVDSSNVDTVAVVDSAASSLTGKAAIVAKTWKAMEFETPTAKLTSELVDIVFQFKNDGNFNYSEDGKKENGAWEVNEEGTLIMLRYMDDSKADYTIKELSDNKMILTGKAHGMLRTYTLVPK